jgi:hypothetical protein
MLSISTQPTTVPADREHTRTLTAPRVGVWLLLLAVTTLLSLVDYDSFQVGAWIDDVSYITLARSITQPDVHAWLVAHPAARPVSFPPGYPLFLAPLVALFPHSLVALKLSSLLLTLAIVSLLYWGWPWFAPGFSYRWSVVVAGLYGISRLTIEHTRMVMSEPLFTLLSLVVLLLTERSARGKGSLAQSLMLGAICAYAFTVRSVALFLVAAVFGYLLWRSRARAWRALVPALAAGLVVIALISLAPAADLSGIVPARYFRGQGSIAGPLLAPETVAPVTNAGENDAGDAPGVGLAALLNTYVKEGMIQRFGYDLDALVVPIGGGPVEERITQVLAAPWLPVFIGFVISGIVLLGFAACLVGGRVSAFMTFGAVYLFGTLVWVSEGGRLLYPIFAQILLAFLVGVDVLFSAGMKLVRRARPVSVRARSYVLGAMVVAVSVLSLYQVTKIQDSRIHVGDLAARTQWLMENSAPSAVYMTEQTIIDTVYSGRRVVRYPTGCADAAATWNYIQEHNVSYVLVASHKWWQEVYMPEYTPAAQCVLDALAGLSAAGHVREVYSSGPTLIRVYQVETGSATG